MGVISSLFISLFHTHPRRYLERRYLERRRPSARNKSFCLLNLLYKITSIPQVFFVENQETLFFRSIVEFTIFSITTLFDRHPMRFDFSLVFEAPIKVRLRLVASPKMEYGREVVIPKALSEHMVAQHN